MIALPFLIAGSIVAAVAFRRGYHHGRRSRQPEIDTLHTRLRHHYEIISALSLALDSHTAQIRRLIFRPVPASQPGIRFSRN